MSFGIKPLGDKLVIKKMEAEEKTASGIVLPGQAKEQPQIAEVVAVGPGTKDEPMEVKVGDKVIFRKYGGDDIKYNGEEYMIVSQHDILATMK
ncbi:MAG: co-chaperone GroES [Anaerovoracaceae bacterium]|jgi:chaperonin GroES|nr:co-chaperone GroES [Bacillota bacterium]